MRLFRLFFVRSQFLPLAPFRILQRLAGSGAAQLSAVMYVCSYFADEKGFSVQRVASEWTIIHIRIQFLTKTSALLTRLTRLSVPQTLSADEKGNCDPPAAPAWKLSTSG